MSVRKHFGSRARCADFDCAKLFYHESTMYLVVCSDLCFATVD